MNSQLRRSCNKYMSKEIKACKISKNVLQQANLAKTFLHPHISKTIKELHQGLYGATQDQ
jgi:hypothetical protein